MTTLKLATTTTFEVDTCAECAIQFAYPTKFQQERRKDHRTFYCPNGHPLVFKAETEEERLKKELDRARAATADWRAEAARVEAEREREKRAHAATKGVLTKTRARISNGVCPDCNRTFVNLQRHMASKHKEHVNG